MSQTAGVTPAANMHVFLTGRPPMNEYIGIATQLAVGGSPAQVGEASRKWREANAHIRELESSEAGVADNPPIKDLPDALSELSKMVLQDPIFQRAYAMLPARICLIELDSLVVFQKHINLEYTERLRGRLGNAPSSEELFRFCLPFDHPVPPVTIQRMGAGLAFFSPSMDLRVLDVTPLTPGQVSGYASQGPVAGLLAAVIGFGSNFLNALHVENRLILNNGSHRSYAMREAGITEVPCIVQTVSTRDELEAVANPELHQKADLYLKSPRPPLLKDYFDDKLRSVLPFPRQVQQIVVSMQAQQLNMPAQ